MNKCKSKVAGVVLASVLWGNAAQAQYFERVYDGPFNGADTAMSLSTASDGGYYIAGATMSGLFSDQYMVRVNSAGIQQWDANWGNSLSDEYFREVQSLSAGGFVAAGNDRTTRADGGNTVQWSNMELLPGAGMARAESVKSLNSGAQFISCGTWTDGTDRQATLVLRNAAGDTLWTKRYGSPTTDETATSVVQTPNGFAFIGLRNGIVALTLTDANGVQNAVYNYTYVQEGGAGSVKGPFSLQNTSDGGFIFVGSNPGSIRVVKTDASGTVQWVYDPQGGATGHFGAVKQLSDGSYIFTTGMKQNWDSEYRLCIQRLSSAGVVQVSRVFQTGHASMGTDIIQTPNGFAACGIIQPYPGAQTDFYLVATDPNLMVNNSPCNLVAAHNFSPGSCGGTLVYTSNGGPGQFIVSLNDVAVATSPAGTLPVTPGSYSFMITNIQTDGCIYSYEDSVLVNGPFAVNAGPDLTACQTTATMNATVTPSGTYSYSWSPSYIFSNPNVLNPIVTANVVNQEATLTVTNGSGCAVSDDVVITHAEAVTQTYDLCSGPVTLDYGPGASNPIWQYYTPPGGTAQMINQQTQTLVASQPGQYMGFAFYGGCSAITSVVTVNDCSQTCWNEFTQTISPQGCVAQVCFFSTGSSGISTYLWYVDGMPMATTANPCVNLFGGSHNVTLTTVDANGCTAQTTHTVFITTGLITTLADTVTACQAPATLSVSATGGSGDYSYFWSPSNGQSPNDQATYQVSMVHQQLFTVSVSDNVTGCSITDSVLVSSYTQILEDSVYLCTDSVLLDMGPGGTFYNWGSISNNYQSQTAWVSQPGQYVVYGVFPNSCTAITSVIRVFPCAQSCFSLISGNLTYNNCEATSCVTISGSPAIAEVQWSNGSTGLQTCYAGLWPGLTDITATVLHVDGCTSTATYQVSVPQLLTADLFQDTVACNGQLFGLGINPTSGSGNYSYDWQPQGLLTNPNMQTTSINQSLTAPVWIFCTVTDNVTGCDVTDSLIVYPNIQQTQTLSQCDGPFTFTLDPGSMVYSWQFTDQGGMVFNWGNGTNTVQGYYAGTYTCMTYYSGCNQVIHTFVVDTCLNDEVWPGDANSDNVVSNTDALWVGIAFNQTGPVRPGATLNWVGQACPDWAFDFSAIGENLKHADCNGSGTVNYADTLAITQNYSLTHNKTEDEAGGSGPVLWVQAVQDTVGLGHGIDFTVNLATAGLPVDSLHGVSFTLTFDGWLAQQPGMYVHHDGNVLGAVGTNALSFQKASFIDGAIDVAISRTTGVNFNGFGPVAEGRIVTTDNLAGIQEMRIGVSNVTALTAHGLEVALGTMPDSVVIDPNRTGISESTIPGLRVAPNPSAGPIVLSMPTGNYQCTLLDATGRAVLTQRILGPRALVDPGQLASGTYTLHLVDATGRTASVLVLRAE